MKAIQRIAAITVGVLLAVGTTAVSPVGVQPARADMSSVPSDQVALGKLLKGYHDSGLLTTYCTIDENSAVPCASNLGGTDAIYQREILPLAQGQVPTPGSSCSVDTRVLQLLVLTIDHFQQSVNVTDLERYCVGSQLSKNQHGAQAGHGGWAIDIDSIGGVAVNGSSAKDADFLAFLLSIKPSTGSLHVGQTLCAGHVNYSAFNNFSDSCTHQHIDFSTTSTGLAIPSLARAAITADGNADGRVQFFAIGGDGKVYTKAQSVANGAIDTSSGSFSMIPASATDISASKSIDGRIELFYVNADGSIGHRAQSAPNGAFGVEDSFGGNLSPSITSAVNSDGRLQFFAVGADGNIYSKAQSAPNGGFSSAWSSLTANARDIASTMSVDGRIELFYVATDGTLRHRAQTAPNGAFGQEDNFGGNLRGPLTAARNADGRLQVFAVGTDGAIYSRAQSSPNGGFSSTWSSLQASSRDLAATTSADGRLELFSVETDGSVHNRSQTTPNGNFGVDISLSGNLRNG